MPLAVDYEWHSIVTEYLDDGEKSELLTGLRDAGFAVTVYDGERAFLRAVLNGEWQECVSEQICIQHHGFWDRPSQDKPDPSVLRPVSNTHLFG